MNGDIKYDKSETLSLNGLKGFACLIIAFVWHYQHFAPANGSPFYSIFNVSYRSGLYFVELFFMVSGFVMTLGYASKVASREIRFGAFMKRRILKIYPLYLVALLLVTLAEAVYRHGNGTTFVYENFDLKHFLMHLFCVQGGIMSTDWSFNAPSWCITICLVMYLLFFMIMRTFGIRKATVLPWAALFVAGNIIVWKDADMPVINQLMARGLICFPLGVLLAFLWLNAPEKVKLPSGIIAVAGAAAIYLYLRNTDPLDPDKTQMIYSFVFSPLLIIAALNFMPLNRILASRPAQYLGKLSVPIYLLHFFVQCSIATLDRHFEWGLNYSGRKVWLLYVVITLAVAAIYQAVSAQIAIKVKAVSDPGSSTSA